jgi:acetyl-CoA carboxylase carboxyltransferase component
VTSRLRELSAQVRELEDRVRAGGGPERVAKQHKQGKLTARERVTRLCDNDTRFLEIGLLVAHDQYEGEAPSAGVVTGVGIVGGSACSQRRNRPALATVSAHFRDYSDGGTGRSSGP